MKRLTALLLVLVMAVLAFAACGEAVTTEEPKGNSSTEEELSSKEPSASEQTSEEGTPSAEESTAPVESSKEEPQLPADPTEVLKGKKALFLGDSIVAASGYRFEGWPYRIKTANQMIVCKNVGRDGASLSTCRGENLVYNHMMNNYASDKTKYDFVVLEGGVNDAWDFYALDGRPACPVGDVTPGTAEDTVIEDLDRTTMAGGMEHLLYNAKKLYPEATIIFVFNFKLRTGTPGRCGDMDEYIEVQKKICDKWGIPYCNLYENEQLNKDLKVRYSSQNVACVPDGIHPNDKGYDLIAPVIAQTMADEYVKAHA